jgi:UDP-N-acetylmuramoylalanine--D-glutamate ligase
VAITGTNGKTTTTALMSHLLNECGIPARVAGNIGTPCIEAVTRRGEGEYLVVELSSYQLYSMPSFAPKAAVLLNITPDHLSWHGSHEAYIAAKRQLFANLGPEALAVIDADSEATAALVGELRAAGRRVVEIDAGRGIDGAGRERLDGRDAAYVSEGPRCLTVALEDGIHVLSHTSDLQIRGGHNMANALAAAATALWLGVGDAPLSQALQSFRPLEHRLEPCGEVDSVRYYNDSKATNTDAAIKAMQSFGEADGRRVVALFGGRDKGTPLDELVCACSGNCRVCICYGEAAARFHRAFSACDAFEAVREADFASAIRRATEMARPGDVVVLSPACASFDEFEGFEARGLAFKSYVASLEGGHNGC